MARKAREVSSTGNYAVILRGIDKIFEDRAMKGIFCATADGFLGNRLLAIRFYDDRAEMLVSESEKGISMDMKPLVTSFARSYNRIMESTGKVFADRFKSVPVETDELLKECLAYLKGGEPAAPFKSRARGASAAGKKPEKKPAQVKREEPAGAAAPEPSEKIIPPVQEAPQQETAPKPKKKNSLPSWLL